MKRLLTIIAMFMVTLCGSIFLVSCSGSYKKMYLTIEYAIPTEDGKDVEWISVEKNTNFDYILSNSVYSEQDMAHILYLRIKVKGTSKKVDSLYVSQSGNVSTFLESNVVKPNEGFKVKVKEFGSVRFTITPSNGGEDKAVSFGVNIYKELTEIYQNPNCVPAVVTGGYIKLESLTDLIKYEPLGQTNQTGVDFEITGIGSLINNGNSNLLERDFARNNDYEIQDGLTATNNKGETVRLETSTGYLMLNVANGYELTSSNNVIELKATSRYMNTKTKEYPSNLFYAYIVENAMPGSLLVSYSEDVKLEDGKVPTDVEVSLPIDNNITLYNSIGYNAINMYTYTNASIYSYETNPGIVLRVYINGEEYYYNFNNGDDLNAEQIKKYEEQKLKFGIQISPITRNVFGINKLIGLKYEVNPNSSSKTNVYNIKMELDFTAFNFSASDKKPAEVLNKSFVINVESLPSGIAINNKEYNDNLSKQDPVAITGYNSNQPAKLYTNYSPSAIGMPITIQATPAGELDAEVKVGFYSNVEFENGQLSLKDDDNLDKKIQLWRSFNNGFSPNNGEFIIDSNAQSKLLYLRFNEGVDLSKIDYVYMICRVACTPDHFGLQNDIEKQYITVISKIQVVGAIDQVFVYKQEEHNIKEDTLVDAYLANGEINTAYINFSTKSQNPVLSEISIKSQNNNILFSADTNTWYKTISADKLSMSSGANKYGVLYFKTEKECVDSLVITSLNGVSKQIEYNFVNIVNNVDKVDIKYEQNYIWTSPIETEVGILGVTDSSAINLKYLALQSGRAVQFKASENGRTNNIKAVNAKSLLVTSFEYDKISKDGENALYASAISTFSSTAIRVANTGSYLFDVRANSVGFTSILLVRVDYFAKDTSNNAGVIELQSKYFIYEVAVYTPARQLNITSDKDSIIYVNDNYPDVAKINFEIGLNSATRTIAFSSNEVNEAINLSYSGEDIKSIYGISVQPSENVKEDYFVVNGLKTFTYTQGNETISADFVDINTKKFSVQAIKDLKELQKQGINAISFDIVIYQFGEEKEVTRITKVIYFGDYSTTTDIIVVSGVESYNNIYLNLLNGEVNHIVEAYASNDEGEVTFKELGYRLFQLDNNGNKFNYSGNNLKIVHNVEENTFNITAKDNGGVYLLELFAKDSYDSDKQTEKVKHQIKITISDGKSDETAYLIRNLGDFKALANKNTEGQYYRLWQNIDISALDDDGWWKKSRTFAGNLDGSITIEDPNTGNKIDKCYSLKNLIINKVYNAGDANCFGLFTSVTGTIANVIFDNVVIEIDINADNSSVSSATNIGIITAINTGKIENCSVNISASEINFTTSANNTTYNIGLIAGLNNGTISYANANSGSVYSHIVDCVSTGYRAGKLTINVEEINTNFASNTNLHIGGVAGQNALGATIKGDYDANKSKSVRELINAVVNIEVVVGYGDSNPIKNINTIDIGGIVGLNAGEIKNIVATGSIIANDKVNIGGIAGVNSGKVTEVANYGTHIEAGIYNPEFANTNQHVFVTGGNQEQNIGGIIGVNNAGIVDNVRTMFILFEQDEVSIASNSALIKGVGNVGGIIGKANNTQLTRAYVENFVSDNEAGRNYNIIGGNGANVAGLIAYSTNSSAVLCFVQADFSVEGCSFYEFGKDVIYNYVYFIGEALVNANTTGHNSVEGKNAYIIINDNSYGLTAVKALIEIENGISDKFEVGNFEIQWQQSKEEGVNDNQPYLVYYLNKNYENPYHTLTIRPTDIIVKADQNYFEQNPEDVKFKKYDNGIYIEYDEDGTTTSTAIVYYVEGANNTHYLVSENTQKGLIEKTILPTIADDTYAVSIVTGSNIASLTDAGKTITFYGVGRVELKFVSIFDRTKADTVVIFVENPLNEEVFEVSASAGLEDRTQEGDRFATKVGTSAILSVSLKGVDSQIFDSAKTYMKYEIGTDFKVNGNAPDAGKALTDYLTLNINAITQEIDAGKYGLGQFELTVDIKDSTCGYIEIPIKIGIYLNTNNYIINNKSLTSMIGDVQTLLSEKTITIIVYNKATALNVSSNAKLESGMSVDIVSSLTTGYVDKNYVANTSISSTIVGSQGNRLILEHDYDKVDIILTAVNQNAMDLFNSAKLKADNPDEFKIWDLFDYVVMGKLLTNGSGYTYTLNLSLKTEYRYLDVSGYTDYEWLFNFNIVASSNSELSKNVQIAFTPQQLINFRLENYSNLIVKPNGTGAVAEFESSQTESSLIIPKESGLIKIFAEYDYSYFENISISASTINVGGVDYFVRMQQMVYNPVTKLYESYSGITLQGETLTLKKVTYSNGDYDGVIFVRTILDEIVGVRKTINFTVNATTYDLEGNEIPISRTKTLISQYRPGVYVSVNNALTSEKEIEENGQTVNKKVYLVEQNSNVTKIVARVYGYEFNIQPTITITDINKNLLDAGEVSVLQDGAVEKDLTGAYVITYKLAVNTDKDFKVFIEMSLIDNGNTLTSEKEELLFCPVPYIINDVYVKGVANDELVIAVNSSKNLELTWTTKSTTSDKINDINNAINNEKNNLNFLNLFYINQFNASGQDYQKHLDEFLDAEGYAFTIKQNPDGSYRIDSLMKVAPIPVFFSLWYGYNTADGSVMFSASRTPECNNPISYQFTLNLIMSTTEDAPLPIYTSDDLKSMAEGENYILMNDIIVENWTPLTTAIDSLDGNGKIINIKSFNIAVTTSVNAGLFAIVSENTILKNIVVNIGTMENNLGANSTVIYIKDENITQVNVNFGLLAGVNNGLIYNCEVLSMNSIKTLELVVDNGYTLTFGGLVGVNNGNITNSRVGTEYFEKLTYADGVVVSSIVHCSRINLKTRGVVGGFVGKNDKVGIISSSYVANTSVENYSTNPDSNINRTAGFVATNSGMIAYSYVKGLERNILTTKSTTGAINSNDVECIIYASGAGSVAGFAYLNEGEIHDCYTNTVCKSNSAGVAGFVYNTLNGKVVQCYSATIIKNTDLSTELPFIGVGLEKDENAAHLLSSKNVINCYYLDDGYEYDTNYILPVDAVEPKGLKLESFSNSSNLNNFSFINSSLTEQQLNGVWTYSTTIDKNKSTYILSSTALPELTSANTISRSIRVFADNSNAVEKSYKYPQGYELGSKNNPYIIRSVDEYKSVFVNENRKNTEGKLYVTGYVRFVDNISFKVDNSYIDINTRSNYILGDKGNEKFTLVDGNGMTISDVVINYTEEEEEDRNLGLFSEVHNSVIKGLNIKYATQTNSLGNEVGSSTAKYVGGVAGVATNTYFIDLNLSGAVTLRAHNVVGGVVGKLVGSNSGLYNLTSNISVQAGNYNPSGLYEGEDSDVVYLSYAGGIAGIIDIGSNNQETYNVNKLTVDSAKIRANRAGGIAGYLGDNVIAERLTYTISSNSQIFGREVAGGMVADNFANISLSQINGELDQQYDYDKAFGQYITQVTKDIEDKVVVGINNDENQYGNMNAITGSQVVGGFVGVNYSGNIANSLTKANIGANDDYGMPKTIGGFIGKTYGGNLNFVYAQNYIDLMYQVKDGEGNIVPYYPQVVGGLVGEMAYSEINAEQYSALGLDNVVVMSWFDEAEVDAWTSMKKELNKTDYNIDYLIGKRNNQADVRKLNSEIGSKPIVSYGVFKPDGDNPNIYRGEKIANKNLGDNDVAVSFDMPALYYVPTGADTSGYSTQQDIFNTLFAIWPEDCWEKVYTKFTPNLKLDNATDYIPISKKEDILLMEQFPNRNFVLVNDVEITEDESNYVVNANFEGILIGTKKENGEYTKFKITLNALTSRGKGAGFFKQTTNARIANIGFEYKELNLDGNVENGNTYERVGGVSAQDNNSRFEQVAVTQYNPTDASVTTSNASVAMVGSIVAEATQSKIISCSSNLQYKLDVNDSQTGEVNIGGLVGVLYGGDYDENTRDTLFEGLINSSSYSGKMTINSLKRLNLGGIVASATYTRISSASVRKVGEDSISSVEIEISSKNQNYIGGIIGVSDMCSIGSAMVEMSVADIETTPAVATAVNNIDTTYYVGGIISTIRDQAQMDSSIDDSYARLTYNIKDTANAYVGGIVAHQNSSSIIEINNVVSEIIIPTAINGTATGVQDVVDNMVIGGIVALAGGDSEYKTKNGYPTLYGCTNINDSVSILNCDIDYNASLVGGGLIGSATGSYMINSSTSMGYILANSEEGVHFTANATQTTTILGGLVGIAEKVEQSITKSYTALTLNTAGVYRGEYKDPTDDTKNISHDVYVNSIVGQSSGPISIENVLYSSDYTLALEENEIEINNTTTSKFTVNPINVTANVLTNSDIVLASNVDGVLKGILGANWIMKGGYLPMPAEAQDLLFEMKILEYVEGSANIIFNEDHKGKAYYPIKVTTDNITSITSFASVDNKYNYYNLLSDLTIGTGNKGNLNGVLLGNNRIINNGGIALFETITKNSAISNLTFVLGSTFTGESAVTNTNNGTIFMIGVQYDNINIGDKFGALASENKGVISQCYNSGNATTSGSPSGLVRINNKNAVITDSYFTGSFVSGTATTDYVLKGYSLTSKNEGYIANSYTAGSTGNIIDEYKDGRYNNVTYDYYANFVTEAEYANLDKVSITGKSTREMQAVADTGVIDSEVIPGWKVYGLINWFQIDWQSLNSSPNTNEPVRNIMTSTYNYGYPVHDIKQLTYYEGVKYTNLRVKATGDGTFVKNNSIEAPDIKNETQGKLVTSTEQNADGEDVKVYYDNFAFQINNLGVLELINTLKDTTGKYFELAVNMVLPNQSTDKYKEDSLSLITDWKGVGVEDNKFKGVFFGASDKFIPNTTIGLNEYTMDTTLAKETLDSNNISFNTDAYIVESNNPKIITNLTGNALFGEVSGALITNVTLKNTHTNNAPFINKVSAGTTTLYKVAIDKVYVNTQKAVAGMVNTVVEDNISKGILNIHSVEQSSINIINDGKIAGIIAGVALKNEGTINIKNSFKGTNVTIEQATSTEISGFVDSNAGTINIVEAVDITLNAINDNTGSVSGFARENVGSIINKEEENSSITVHEVKKTDKFIAGLVGEMGSSSAEVVSNPLIAGFDVVFDFEDEKPYITQTFGGVVATMHGGKLGTTEDEDVKPINVTLSRATADIYGGVVAVANGGSIVNVSIDCKEDNIVVNGNDDNPNANAYGLVIGQYEKLNEINYKLKQEIKFKAFDGINVGGIVGLVTSNTNDSGSFIFTNSIDDIKIVTVCGANNVGGFIGCYAGSNVLKFSTIKQADGSETESEKWMLTEEFAKVEFIATNNEPSQLVSGEFKNFGGIFGCWSSSSEISITGVEEIVNKNKVLTFEDGMEEYIVNAFSNIKDKTLYDYSISNIGGVVGYSNATIQNAINQAQIGYKFEEDLGNHNSVNPISGVKSGNLTEDSTINEIMQFSYVGGVVGFVNKTDNQGNHASISLVNCSNSADVYGMYAVGGVIGGTYSEVNIEISNAANASTGATGAGTNGALTGSGTILGLSDVGGIIGKATTFSYTTKVDQGALFTNVIGILNVGGMVGSAERINISTSNNKIEFESSRVIGNLNVGGLVGYSTLATIESVTLSGVVVYGSVFDYKYNVTTATGTEMEDFYYLPTNIGGIAGYVSFANNGATYTMSKFNAVNADVDVRTDVDFKINDKETCQVNMTQNHNGTLDDIGSGSYIGNGVVNIAYLEQFYKQKAVKYNAVDGGIGGFIGKVDGTTVENVDKTPEFINCTTGGDVYAPYGINVGGIIGYLNSNPCIELPSLPTPTDPYSTDIDSVNVAGKVFVGGYVGKTQGVQNGFFDKNPVGFVNVQQYYVLDASGTSTTETAVMTGSCIGGIFGCVKGNATGLSLSTNMNNNNYAMIGSYSRIRVYNSDGSRLDSSYVGALIGQLDGSMENCSLPSQLCDAKLDVSTNSYVPIDYKDSTKTYGQYGIITKPYVYNYGGLVGLVRAPKGSMKNSEIGALQILGTHYYAFTVDMVQNQDYGQGSNSYSLIDGILTANAHYINQSDMEISATKLSSLYYTSITSGSTRLGLFGNPTNSRAKGWAKGYTMFRQLARFEQQNNEVTGDYIQVIYSANYVTEVVSTLDQIVYTVYQPIGQTAMLYCRYGIAQLKSDFESTMFEKDDNGGFKLKDGNKIIIHEDIDAGTDQTFAYELNAEVYLDGDDWKCDKISTSETNFKGGTNRAAFFKHISSLNEIIPSDASIDDYLNDEGKIEWGVDDDFHTPALRYQFTFGHSYFKIENYLSQTGEDKDSYFIFTIVFGSIDRGEKLDTLTESSDYLYSNSGSIFEITGTAVGLNIGEVKNKEWALAWLAAAVAVVVCIVLLIIPFTREMFLLVLSYVPYMGWVIAANGLWFSLGLGLALVTGAGFLISQTISLAQYTVLGQFNSIEETSLGYLASSYGRDIGWRYGEMDPYYDTMVLIDVEATFDRNVTSLDSKFGDYHYGKLMLKELGVTEGSNKCIIPLQYFCCSSSGNVPNDINRSVEIRVADLDKSDMKDVLVELDVTSLSIPKYVKVDNELYSYVGEGDCSYSLYTNYEDVKTMSGLNLDDDKTLINVNGYAYVLSDNGFFDDLIIGDETYNTGETAKKYLEQYGLTRTINKTVKHSLSDTLDASAKKLTDSDKEKIKWREVESNNGEDFVYEKDLYDAGTTKPAGGIGYITRIEDGKTHYYTTKNNGGEKISVTLRPSNDVDGAGLTYKDLGLETKDMYYVIDNVKGRFYITRTYTLSHKESLNINAGEDGFTILTPIDENLLTSENTITLYQIDKKKKLRNEQLNSKDFSFDDFIVTNAETGKKGVEVSFAELSLKDNLDKYAKYSKSKIYYDPVDEWLAFNDKGELCLKTVNDDYRVDTKQYVKDGEIKTVKYYYRTYYSGEQIAGNFSNRYVYKDNDLNIYLYTRFNYGNGFLKSSVKTESGNKSIKSILLPNSADRIEVKNIIFAESARISLSSAKNVTIWLNYRDGERYQEYLGSITCK